MKFRKVSNFIIVFFLAVLAVLSVHGAFLGAARAQAFFNTPPMTVFWCLLLVFLSAGFFIYPSLKKRYPLILIHFGCIMVLVGGLYGSHTSHRLLSRWFGGPSFTKATMQLAQGQLSNLVTTEATGDVAELPFSLFLKDASIEYYGEPGIRFRWSQSGYIDIPAEVSGPIQLPENLGTIQVVKFYRNFKLKSQDGRMIPYDAEGPDSNPAWELLVTTEDGGTEMLFVFERFPMHAMGTGAYRAEFLAPQMVKDYKSMLQVIDRGKPVKESTIEVNKPLYYGGYHFYQHTFGFNASGPVSGILVTSARGVGAVFAGYTVIFVGLVIQCWTKLYRGSSQADTNTAESGRANHRSAGGLQ